MEKFRADFRSISWQRGQVTEAKAHVAKLTRYDKDGSHSKAILRAQDELKNQITLLRNKMDVYKDGGKLNEDYTYLLDASRKISVLSGKLKAAKTSGTRNRVLAAINEYNPFK